MDVPRRRISARLAACAAITFVALTLRGGTFTVFGPRDYVRAAGQPQTVRANFTVTHTAAPYRLRVVNRGAAGTFDRVTSATVKVNGQDVFGPNDFNGNSPVTMEKPITVAATNEIAVELRDAPGSGFTVSILGDDNSAPIVHATVTPASSTGWHGGAGASVVVSFSCDDALTPVVSCSPSVVVSQEGPNQIITGSATDSAGNTGSTSVSVNIDRGGPSVAPGAPVVGTILTTPSVTLSGSVSDTLSGIQSLTCDGRPATLSGSSYQCTVVLQEGANGVELQAIDRAGNESQQLHPLVLDTRPPQISITSPAAGALTNAGSIAVAGIADDDGGIAQVTVNGAAVELTGGRFATTIPVLDGTNSIDAEAVDRAGHSARASASVTRVVVPAVTITSPADLAFVAGSVTQVRGTVTNASSVDVNGVAAVVAGGTFIAEGVALAQGRTVVTATATGTAGHIGTRSILVYRDAIPPRLMVSYPPEGAVLHDPTVDVSGTIDDIAVGTINSGQARVTVGGNEAMVSNRVFLARGVSLTAGANTIVSSAVDQGGNTVTVARQVTYRPLTAEARIAVASGDGQSGSISAVLPQPIAARLTTAAGTPASNRVVVFRIVANNGSLTAGSVTGRVVSATTDVDGVASVHWALGTRAGAGNQVVEATASGFAGTARFEATGQMASPAMIVVDSGDNQYGVLGDLLPRPTVAVVTDAGSNRIGGVPVTFRVIEGGGSFANGEQTIIVTTDSDGRAWVTPRLGSGSTARQRFRASVPGVASRASFGATGRVAGPPSGTSITGVVLDNTDSAIAGVTIRIDGSSLTTTTDANGQFILAPAPVGYGKLLVDGTTAQRSGTWPTLEFAMYTLPGQNNTLGMPIYLLPLDVQRGLFVDEVNGGTLTLPELPGFSLTVKPGSVTFPGGSRTGTVSVTMVHNDKMPMPPGFGQQPRFIVTIQPVGAHFDPPAAITFPNVDGLEPGRITELYSFDHDLGQFVAIGTGTVSEDGSMLQSDPGIGIVKAGWHCGGDPAANGTTADCPDCEKCENDECGPDSGQNGNQCENTPCKECSDGSCVCKTSTDTPLASTGGGTSTAETAPTIALPMTHLGLVWPEKVDAQVSARPDDCRWRLKAEHITGLYSVQIDLTGRATEVQPGSNSDSTNYCAQITDLYMGGEFARTWYSTQAVTRHEAVHEASMGITLGNAIWEMEAIIEELSTACSPGVGAGEAAAKIRASAQWAVAMNQARSAWRTAIIARGNVDHEGPTMEAEMTVTIPLIQELCTMGNTNGWPTCGLCSSLEP